MTNSEILDRYRERMEKLTEEHVERIRKIHADSIGWNRKEAFWSGLFVGVWFSGAAVWVLSLVAAHCHA